MKHPFYSLAHACSVTRFLPLALLAALLAAHNAHAYNFTVGISGGDPFTSNVLSCQATFDASSAKTGQVRANCTDGSFIVFTLTTDESNMVRYSLSGMTLAYMDISQEATTFDSTLRNAVSTVRGEIFSRFYNLTGENLTINNTTLSAKTSATINYPWYLTFSGAGTNSYRLVSAKSGEQILTILDNNTRTYIPSADDIVIYKLRPTPAAGLDMSQIKGDILYGDINTENQDKILFSKSGSPVYGEYCFSTTNIYLKTEWVFSHNDWGSAPLAYINDDCVCDAHSTTHIIDYKVNAEDTKFDTLTGVGSFSFTMSLKPTPSTSDSASYTGGDCNMRCWVASAKDYDSAPDGHRASINAGTGVATFRFIMNFYTGEWKVEPQ